MFEMRRGKNLLNGSICDSVKKPSFRVEGMWEVFTVSGRPMKLFLLLYSSKPSCKDFFCQSGVRFLTGKGFSINQEKSVFWGAADHEYHLQQYWFRQEHNFHNRHVLCCDYTLVQWMVLIQISVTSQKWLSVFTVWISYIVVRIKVSQMCNRFTCIHLTLDSS